MINSVGPAVMMVVTLATAGCTASLDQDTAEHLQEVADAFEPPSSWERPDRADGPFAEQGFPDLWLIADDFGTKSNDCPAGQDIQCLQIQRTWELDPDDLDSQTGTAPPLLPAQVEQLRAAITDTAGWDIATDPDCVLDQDTAGGRDDGCTWKAVAGDVDVLIRPQRPDSTQPWKLELRVHHASFAYDVTTGSPPP